eukprot:scaffold22505_cov17-Prasinocladus_malaysianus.AAC.1
MLPGGSPYRYSYWFLLAVRAEEVLVRHAIARVPEHEIIGSAILMYGTTRSSVNLGTGYRTVATSDH